MPAYTIAYRQHEHVTPERIEWITPAGWSEQQIRKDFEDRYHATVVELQRLPE